MSPLAISFWLAMLLSSAAACPFAGLKGAVNPHGRKLLQTLPPGCSLTSPPPPLSPSGPSTTTSNDNFVRTTAYNYLKKVLTLSDGTPKTDRPLGGFVRAAFHDAGTYNKSANTGGANGSLMIASENTMAPHNGLNRTITDLIKFRTDINAQLGGKIISYADLIQLSGAVAVEVTGGGPSFVSSIPMGRIDATTADSLLVLPGRNDNYNKIACRFVMNGYTIQEMYALTGSHTVGFTNKTFALSPTPNGFNVDYWTQLQSGGGVLPSDKLMASANPTIVNNYAANFNQFLTDFKAAYVKMGKMGAKWKNY